MSPAHIYVSGGFYSSAELHQSNRWHRVGLLQKQAHGRYTAVVDGRAGHITINAVGWWFEPAAELSPAKAEEAIGHAS